MADYYEIESNGYGGFTVTPRNYLGCGGIITFIIVLLIAGFLLTQCESDTPTQDPQQPTASVQSGQGNSGNNGTNTQVPTSMNLTELRVHDCHTNVTGNNINKNGVTDPFGKYYAGSYFCLTSNDTLTGVKEAYTELVAGENYKYLSGTYFADAEYDDRQVCFRIYADGTLIYDSGYITRGDSAVPFTVNITNANIIRISSFVRDGDNHAHIILVNATVHN